MHKVVSRAASVPSRSATAVLIFGLVLGLVLALALGYVAAADRHNRLVAAEHQSRALLTGTGRLVWLELRNLERALLGVVGDAERIFHESPPDQARPRLADAIAGVRRRQPEFESIVLTDEHGRALSPGRGDVSIAQWSRGTAGSRMAVGPAQRAGNAWVLPLFVSTADGHGILARLHVRELQNLIADIDSGHDGHVQITDRTGTVLADSRSASLIGQRLPGFRPVASAERVEPAHVSPLDRVPRIVATRQVRAYPLQVSVGLSRAAILTPWWMLLSSGLLLYIVYWAGLWYVVGVVRRHARVNSKLVARLAETADGLQLAQQLGRTGTWTAERDRRVTWSEQAGQLFGFDPARRSASLDEFMAPIHPRDRERVDEHFARAWSCLEPFSVDYRIVLPHGLVRWLSVRGACVPGVDGQMTGSVVDISERMEAQQRAEDAEHQFRQLFERNPLPFWVFDVGSLRFLEVNEAAIKQYGYSREEFLAMTILDIRPAEDRPRVMAEVARHASRLSFDDAPVWQHRRKDGVLLQVKIYSVDIQFNGRPARLVLAEDVTEHLAFERELAYRASHDMTTGLLNARALADEMQAAGGPSRVAYVQVRGLELIEDSLGRKAGEDTLRAIARRLERLGQQYGLAGHVRSDEFAVVVHDLQRWPEVQALLQAELARPVPGRDTLQKLESWWGTADFPADGEDAFQVIGNAGIAAHLARAERLATVRFEPRMAQRASDRLQLAGRIHRAIEDGEFVLFFQTIRHVADGRPAALEALVRWPQPDGSFVPPSEFITICEDSGLIVPLGQWVLREAARAQQRLDEEGFGELPVAVNVSLVQFRNSDLADDVEAVLKEFRLRRGALHVELTESVLMTRPEQALLTLRRLQDGGVCVSLDDFGTGFSSMSYLRHLPLDALKIDRSFVHDVDVDERNASICLALLSLGHNLGLTVVAEGVENERQYEWLRRNGCDQLQGYGFDRPAPLAEVLDRLRAMHPTNAVPWRHAGAGRR